MLNICPIGRNCSKEERMEFSEIDKVRVFPAEASEASKLQTLPPHTSTTMQSYLEAAS